MEYIDVILGKKVYIDNEFGSSVFFNYFNLIEDGESKSNFVIALKMDSMQEVKYISKRHVKHKQILKLINNSEEHGIRKRVDQLTNHGFLLLYYLFKQFAQPELVDMIDEDVFNRKRIQITFNELSSVFILLMTLLFSSFIVLVIELFYHRFSSKYNKVQPLRKTHQNT